MSAPFGWVATTFRAAMSETTDGSTPTPNSNAETDAGQEEQIRKVYVRSLKEKDTLHTVFRVGKKLKHTGRSGKSFLALTLQDKTGEVEARVFDNVDAADAAFSEGDYLLIRGGVITYQKKPQVVISALEKLDPTPLDPAEFTPGAEAAQPEATPQAVPQASKDEEKSESHGGGDGAPRSAIHHIQQIREIVNRVHDPHVKELLLAFLDDSTIAEGLKVAPAAKGIHHAYRGGLAEHILSVMRLAHRIADHYPMADRDLLTAGALLHDIMKVKEISSEKGFEYTDEGRLVGHLVMTAQAVREKASRIDGFPPLLEHHITHIVLAHHGQLEWGSPKPPMTLEALLVHLVDTIDSRVASWLEFMQRDPNDRWTENSRLYDRHLWKGPVPTSRGRAPVPPRGGGGGGGGGGGAGGGKKRRDRDRDRKPVVEHKAKPAEGKREDRPPKKDGGGGGAGGPPKDLTFKPFSALVGGDTPSSSGGGENAQ